MLILGKMTQQGPVEEGRIDKNGTVCTGNVTLLAVMRGQMPKEPIPTEATWLKTFGHGSRLWVAKA